MYSSVSGTPDFLHFLIKTRSCIRSFLERHHVKSGDIAVFEVRWGRRRNVGRLPCPGVAPAFNKTLILQHFFCREADLILLHTSNAERVCLWCSPVLLFFPVWDYSCSEWGLLSSYLDQPSSAGLRSWYRSRCVYSGDLCSLSCH